DVRELQARLEMMESSVEARRSELRAVEEDIFRRRLQISSDVQKLEKLVPTLQEASQRTGGAISRLRGQLAKKLAPLIEHQSIKAMARIARHAVTILTVVSVVLDVRDAIKLISSLIKVHWHVVIGDAPGDGGDRIGSPDAPIDAPPSAAIPSPAGIESNAPIANGPVGEGSSADPRGAKASLSRVAREIVDGATRDISGPALTAIQLNMLDALIPETLSNTQVKVILDTLRTGPKATTSEQVFDAISKAVRDVQNADSSITVDGVAGPVVGLPADGPITSPSQLETASDVIQAGAVSVIATWFELVDGQLHVTAQGENWKVQNVGKARVRGHLLSGVDTSVTARDSGWDLKIVFMFDSRETVSQAFSVTTDTRPSGLGAMANGLTFEPYSMVR
ncbi:MAG TPA: hypothetical protein VH143_04050, partial [Kofleriaceae bacterium]|nr:hypothetical protein [Kofleriaceae bacterium]